MNATDAPDGSATVVTSLKNWATSPFSTDMSLQKWFLFTGLVIVMVVLWLMIIHETLGEL